MFYTHLGPPRLSDLGSAAGAQLVPKHTVALRKAWSTGQDTLVRGRKMTGASCKLTSCCTQYTQHRACSKQTAARPQVVVTQRTPSLDLTTGKNYVHKDY